ncbi:HutD/Ves family protein [Bradyrhizobium elkanii]|uniref:Environmental stress-induced protein Ves n=1 Tax=Bradyrhizobium elkanii TaxID=29448 RepID=A0A8I2C6P5_BRAEL|nr:HutD family protein [Bradyrhizobium elkanii]MBP1296363.1 environmental stress-induced protein Ves [Bradyrhizobium elkanii]
MRIIRAADCSTTPWKNGGGETTEIAVEPANASLDAFDWRISVARVASDGPFSEFAGIDRSLAVAKGRGLALTIGDAAEIVLDEISEPIPFAGDTPTSARLLAGAITDLNVMTRRGRFVHQLRRLSGPSNCVFADHGVAAVVVVSGEASLIAPQGTVTLMLGDAAILEAAADASCRIVPAAGTVCYLALLSEIRSQPGSA